MLNTEQFGIRKKIIQGEEMLNLYRVNGFKFTGTWFPYTSGQVGNYFIQSVDISADGECYVSAIDHTVEIIKHEIGIDNIDVISGGETRDWDFSNPVAYALHKPHAKLYKNGDIIGAKLEGKRVLHIADLNNEGSSPRDLWVPAIKKAGGKIQHIVFYVDRLEDGVEEMKKLELTSHSVIPLNDEAWETLLKNQCITLEIYESLVERWEDKKAWAHKALFAHTEQLKNMLEHSDEKVSAKAKKILEKGYPEIKQALMEKMYPV